MRCHSKFIIEVELVCFRFDDEDPRAGLNPVTSQSLPRWQIRCPKLAFSGSSRTSTRGVSETLKMTTLGRRRCRRSPSSPCNSDLFSACMIALRHRLPDRSSSSSKDNEANVVPVRDNDSRDKLMDFHKTSQKSPDIGTLQRISGLHPRRDLGSTWRGPAVTGVRSRIDSSGGSDWTIADHSDIGFP